jgi:adenylate cyclase class 2
MGSGRWTESEVKLRVDSPESARARLRSRGAEITRARHFEDNLLFDDRAATLRAARQVLRLRRTADADGGHESRLTLKGRPRVEAGIKLREELETTLGDGDVAEALLERLGYQPVFRYQKYREVWRLDQAEVVVDETPIGCFLEIEAEPGAIVTVAATLGFTPDDFVSASYPSLFAAAGGRGDMVFP